MSALDPAERLAVDELLSAYAEAVDGRDLDALDPLFTADARVDYTALGGPAGTLGELKAFLGPALAGFAATQHLMGLPRVRRDGAELAVRTPCHNPMVFADGQTWLIGLWYDDRLRRDGADWRFAQRRQIRGYTVVGLRDPAVGSTG